MAIAAAGALLAEVSTVLWVGAPADVWQPAIGGFVIGLMAGWFSGRKKSTPKDK
jgi:membrane associated rhomboid family serine protease